MAKLVLIDGHAILHRAYHALPPTIKFNAIFGFMTMLLRVLADLKPDHLAVAFDRPEANFRQQQYTAYQGKRPEMEGNLSDQIPLVHEMLAALAIPYFEVSGFEADDCIGTLARQNTGETIIVTGDRDMLQLVNDHAKVCVPVKGLSETKTYDAKMIEDEFDVKPSQWVDVKALKGDASDNYSGVRG
ncbi:DNA polymerase I, partial [Candidatus Microgenomates bacterium]|nr:DNA polymerase I [Candidatus Microgenomates bacterium]